ncbi:hypothetical protein B0H13DRAFT_2273632 [Mycena leptocephala]|nr:hypothetical protein B0H13DRAFT_2273632 [Mycena leptocephala]
MSRRTFAACSQLGAANPQRTVAGRKPEFGEENVHRDGMWDVAHDVAATYLGQPVPPRTRFMCAELPVYLPPVTAVQKGRASDGTSSAEWSWEHRWSPDTHLGSTRLANAICSCCISQVRFRSDYQIDNNNSQHGDQNPPNVTSPPHKNPRLLLYLDHGRQLSSATNSSVAGIVFMCSEKESDPSTFPFRATTRFLDLSGPSLLQKLTIVPSLPGLDLDSRLGHLKQFGTHILDVSEPSVVLPRLLSWASAGEEERRNQMVEIYRRAATSVRRNAEQAVILLAGHSGHGKSKTVNRLIGQDLLNVGRATLGSTTKVIQRVQVQNRSKELAAAITVAFDDTPGLEDTNYDDRELNASLLRAYKLNHFRGIYPNVILLVVAWDSITPDAHNKPSHFTSALGKTIYALYCSDLVDDQRANTVVVVTKSMSSFHQFDDYKTKKEKYAQWGIEAGRRRGIITDLQRKLFAGSPPWKVVFIENGGGKDMRAKYPFLPDGLLSHQNLYDAVYDIILCPSSDGSQDLVGIQSLQVLTGAAPLGSSAVAQSAVLVRASKDEIIAPDAIVTKPLPQTPAEVIKELAKTYFGATYDNARGTFNLINVLKDQAVELQPSRLRNLPDFQKLSDVCQRRNSRRDVDSDKTDPERLREHYSSDWAFRAAVSKKSQCYILHHVTRVAKAVELELSPGMLTLINRLPPWSSTSDSQSKYTQFFMNYGTHVITHIALGGIVRAVVGNEGGHNVMIFRDGAASVAAELTVFLEQNFPPNDSKKWQETCNKWIQELQNEPVFSPDHTSTEYQPIYALRGLTREQRRDLKSAYQQYVASLPQMSKNADRWDVLNRNDTQLQRKNNLKKAVKTLRDAVTHALYRFWQER